MSEAPANAIEAHDIVKKFGDFTAVDHIDFAVKDGEIFGLLGPNGAGKSTLIRMMVTLLKPTSGTAVINGFDVTKRADDVRRSIGVIPQAMTSDLELSVEENLLIYAKLYGVPRDTSTRLIPELLESVELLQWRHKQVKHLSGGMRRRVEIARGLVHEPRMFFLDGKADPVDRGEVAELLDDAPDVYRECHEAGSSTYIVMPTASRRSLLSTRRRISKVLMSRFVRLTSRWVANAASTPR